MTATRGRIMRARAGEERRTFGKAKGISSGVRGNQAFLKKKKNKIEIQFEAAFRGISQIR